MTKRNNNHRSRAVHRAAKIRRHRARRRARANRHVCWWGPRPATLEHVLGWYRAFVRTAVLSVRVKQKILRLVRHLFAHDAALCMPHHAPWLVLLARQPWLRPLAAWRAPAGCLRDKRDHLARHLLVQYPVSDFLFLGFEPARPAVGIIEGDGWAVRVLADLGRGVSLRSLVETDALPTPLSRKMRHAFLCSPRDLRPITALRLTQIRAGGGGPALVAPLVGTRLGRLHAAHGETTERFWDTVIRWLCRCPDSAALGRAALDELLRWIELRGRQGCPIQLTGRPLHAVQREVAQLSTAERRARGDGFAASGLRSMVVGAWSLHEIRTPEDLHTEGEALKHCVWSYRERVYQHACAIWSLRKAGRRTVTVEVDLQRGCIRQARGMANRMCRPDELGVLRVWAVENGLSLLR